MVDLARLSRIIESHTEWLYVDEKGRSFAVNADEIEAYEHGGRTVFGYMSEVGFRTARLLSYAERDEGFVVQLTANMGRDRSELKFIPRIPASDLTAELHLARLKIAQETAELIRSSFPQSKILDVRLNEAGGRLAQIFFKSDLGENIAAMRDVTSKVSVERVFTSAMLWFDKVSTRKRLPAKRLWLIFDRRNVRDARRLHTLLRSAWRQKIDILEINTRPAIPCLEMLAHRSMASLWRERVKRFTLPHANVPTTLARKIIDLDPKYIDTVFAKNGSTLRFNGLPFARVRSVMGHEAAWFGTAKEMQPLTRENMADLYHLIGELGNDRKGDPPNRLHKHYSAMPEAWLESILRRDITRLDANLYLSPIYNQFRFMSDRVDLLALRKDGRLVIIEIKTSPDREMIFQAAGYWRKIELQRRRGDLAAANLFGGREIADRPAIIYAVAPAWSFHRDHDLFARAIDDQIELWRFELHEDWRKEIKVVSRHRTADQ